jgi:GTP-binding protein
VRVLGRSRVLVPGEGGDDGAYGDGNDDDAGASDGGSSGSGGGGGGGAVLADLSRDGDAVLVARGGRPGFGNKGSSLPFAAQVGGGAYAPHRTGGAGEARFLELELKVIADVGLVGFPNAGKSSLLGALSAAKPRVGDYAFTTLAPTVGVAACRDGFSLTIADIPGLIQGAHADRGLGHDFLRHVERTRVLVYVVDVSRWSRGAGAGALRGGRADDGLSTCDPAADLRILQTELQLYSAALAHTPALVVANKCDVAGARDGVARLRAATRLPVVEFSALRGDNAALLVDSLRWLLLAQAREAAAAQTAAPAPAPAAAAAAAAAAVPGVGRAGRPRRSGGSKARARASKEGA